MSSSKLIRWAGLAAVVAGAMFVIVDLIALFLVGFAPSSGEADASLLLRSAIGGLAEALLLLGLVGLYVRLSEATGILGLISFLLSFVGLVLAQGFVWANLFANLGLALFGVSCLQSRLYPRLAAILLIVGAVINEAAATLASGPGSTLAVYLGTGGHILASLAIAWLGFHLFRRRNGETQRPVGVS